MLKKLQRRFMAIALFALASLVLVQSLAVNVINIYQRDSDIRALLKIIADNHGTLPKSFYENYGYLNGLLTPFGELHINIETPYATEYFFVEMQGNVVTDISTENITGISDKKAFQYASRVFNGEPGFGIIDVYRYYYTVNGNESMIVFIDLQRDLVQTLALAIISTFVSLVTITILVVLIYWLSRKAVKPVADSIQKQKQFITDAGHELKTPLAIISANAEVLEMCEGENEWLTSIKNQTVRMNHLVKNLVDLAKLNEMQDKSTHKLFDISTAVVETAANFETSAVLAGLHYEVSAAENLRFYGNESEIRQLITILCDNAIKYTNPGGDIKLTLYKSGKNVILECYNTCEYLDPNKVTRLFDRFYRGDDSRSRDDQSGGYGIGLSIAKAIVDRHKGKIRVSTSETTALMIRIIL